LRHRTVLFGFPQRLRTLIAEKGRGAGCDADEPAQGEVSLRRCAGPPQGCVGGY
jgi:hypothetical protein